MKDELVEDAPEGSLAHFFEVIDKTGGVPMDTQLDPEKIDDILNEEFADYLIQHQSKFVAINKNTPTRGCLSSYFQQVNDLVFVFPSG